MQMRVHKAIPLKVIGVSRAAIILAVLLLNYFFNRLIIYLLSTHLITLHVGAGYTKNL